MKKIALLIFCMGVALSVTAAPPKVEKVTPPSPSDFQDKYNLKAGDVLILNGGEDSLWTVTGLKMNYVLWQKSGIIVFNVPSETDKGTQFILSCSAKGEISQVLVTVTNEKSPDPKPPGPGPIVPPVNPPDAMMKKYKDAYTADKSVTTDDLKLKALAKLIALYDLAQTECDDVKLTTIELLRTTIRDAGSSLMVQFLDENKLTGTVDKDTRAKEVLKSVRLLIADDTATTFPDDGDLDAATRVKAKLMYKRIYDCLVSLK